MSSEILGLPPCCVCKGEIPVTEGVNVVTLTSVIPRQTIHNHTNNTQEHVVERSSHNYVMCQKLECYLALLDRLRKFTKKQVKKGTKRVAFFFSKTSATSTTAPDSDKKDASTTKTTPPTDPNGC